MNNVAHLRCKELPADDVGDVAMLGEVGDDASAVVVEAASAEQEDDMVEVEVEVDDEEVFNEQVDDEGRIGHDEVEDQDEIGDDEVQDDLPTAGG